jgi:hypothetical protein
MSSNERKTNEARRYMRIFFVVLSAVGALVLGPSLYVGRLQIEKAQLLDERIALRSLPIPGEAPYVRAAEILSLATRKKEVDAVLDFCRHAVMISSMVFLTSLVGVTHYRESKPQPATKRHGHDDVMADRGGRALPTALAQGTLAPSPETHAHKHSLAGVA